MAFKYIAWTLKIESEFKLPTLLPAELAGAPDIKIKSGTVPEALVDPIKSAPGFDASPRSLLLRVQGVAKFLVQDGCTVTIDRCEGVDDDSVALFLLGSCFGALMHQRGWLPMHGSSIRVNGDGWLICGPSGVGKSSLAGALRSLGHPGLSDDVSVIESGAEQSLTLLPGYPQAKMWVDTLEMLGLKADSYDRVRPSVEKRAVPINECFHPEPAELKQIIVLQHTNNPEFRWERFSGFARMQVLRDQTYRPQFRRPSGTHLDQWNHYSNAVMKVPIARVFRPKSGLPPIELAERLLEALSNA